MKDARELDILMAEKVLGHKVYRIKSGAVREELANGQSRPLRSYSLEIAAAWEVAERFGIAVLPVVGGYFALVGTPSGWESPADFISFLQKGEFSEAGAAVAATAPLSICLAAMRAHTKRTETEAETETETETETEPQPDNVTPLPVH